MQIRNYSDDQIQKAEGSDVSEIRLTGRAARSIPRPLGWGGRTPFDLPDILVRQDLELGVLGLLPGLFSGFSANSPRHRARKTRMDAVHASDLNERFACLKFS